MKTSIKIHYLLLWGMLLGFNASLIAQSSPDSSLFKPFGAGLYPKKSKRGLSNISIGGDFRFMGTYMVMQEQYPEFGDLKNRLFIGDDSQLPMLNMNIGLQPSANTSFSVDLFMWTPFTGQYDDFLQSVLLGIKLSGSHATRYGIFQVRTGGIHWCKLSPMTFSTNTGYNRFSLFERNPWDPITRTPFDRYKTYYESGALEQDERWGNQAFHGIIFDGSQLPWDLSFTLMYGKSQLNGGNAPLPNSLMGGRIKKDIKGDHFVTVNAVRSVTFSDSLARQTLGFNLVTSEFEFNWQDKIKLYGEVGAGNYFSPTSNNAIGEAIDLRLRFSEKLTFFPIELRYFRISPNVINNNGNFWNTSIREYNALLDNPGGGSGQANGQTPLLIPFASSLVNIGQLTNNRQGFILSTDLKYKKQKLTIGYSIAGEIEGISDRITYGRPSSALSMSRFWRWNFPVNVGPYDNISKVYRGIYETAIVTDSVPTAKGFNTLEIAYKTSFKLFRRNFALFYLGSFHSVQDRFSVLPVYSKQAYIQSYNQQIEFYYELTPTLILSNYFGYDRIIGNDRTNIDVETLNPRDQMGYSYALGLDFQLSKNVGLYLRQRWMFYKDYSFEDDTFQGSETSLELKIIF